MTSISRISGAPVRLGVGTFQCKQRWMVGRGRVGPRLSARVVRLSKLQDEGKLKDEHASLAKAFCTVKMPRPSDLDASCWEPSGFASPPQNKTSATLG